MDMGASVIARLKNKAKETGKPFQLHFREGYDLLPGENCNALKDKYCPPELRAWEKEWEAKREELSWDDTDSHEVCTGSPCVCSGSLPSSGT